MKISKFAFVPMMAIAACVSNGATSTAKLSPKPALSGGTYNAGGGITVASELREKDGKTMVCGVWAESHLRPANLKGRAAKVVSTAAVYVGSERVAQDLQFMRKVDPQYKYGGLDANCQVTSRPWQAADAGRKPEIRIPKQLVTDKSNASQFIIFKQTGPGAGSPDEKRVAQPEPITESIESRNRLNVPMASDPFVTSYTYRPYGEMRIAAMITNINGKVAVCGFWSKFEREQAYVKSTNLLRKSRTASMLILDGKTIHKNFLFMNQVSKEDFATGTKANCHVTSLAWQSGYSNERIEIDSTRLLGRE